ncbi:phage tail tube protein [Microbacterium sp. No. 7]|uniref:phage tail tube protein n=1 Tax=Microbacterium sp. No. 7 TaxID=1714373 RepID=UPI0006D27D76|nr:hypothetical protein [Microbacterium sp. No. 7]ALJ22042.1 hypothetical protein AOA12_19960 [Microbacterium sp. No. 7]
MSVDSTKLIIPGNGTVFFAPVNTPPPANPLGPAGFNLMADGPGAWRNLGHTSKQNTIAFTKEGGERESLDTFIADAVRTVASSVAWGVTIAALQFDLDNLRLAFNGQVDPTTGGYTVASPAPVQTALFLYFQDATGKLGFWLPNNDVGLGDAPSVDTANFFELPLSGSILAAPPGVIPPVNGRPGLFQIFKSGLVSTSHTLTLLGTPTGGNYRLLVNGVSTADIAHNANNTAIQSAINAVPSVPTATVTAAGGGFTVTFASPGAALAPGTTALTGGTNPTVTVTSS